MAGEGQDGAPGTSRFDVGMAVRTEVLGAEHVARAQAGITAFDANF